MAKKKAQPKKAAPAKKKAAPAPAAPAYPEGGFAALAAEINAAERLVDALPDDYPITDDQMNDLTDLHAAARALLKTTELAVEVFETDQAEE